MNDSVKTIAFVLYPGLTPLDLIGPLHVMTGLEVVEATFGMQRRHHVVVGAEHLDPVPTDTPVQVAATTTLDEVPEPSIVMVPGGGAPTLRQLANPILLDYLRNADRTAGMVTSVCTGSLLIAGAGLLQGRPATTHWAYHRFLERLGATYVRRRWVEDGRYLTGAGVSAGIDTALRLAAILTSDDVARTIHLAIEYDPSAGPSACAFNDTDILFVQAMLPHHDQAVSMSDLLLAKRGVNPEVAALARQITDTQQTEIDTMNGWFEAMGRPQREGGTHQGGLDGMLDENQMQQLDQTNSGDGQRLFLEGMIKHHNGAIEMANKEITDGQHPGAVDRPRTPPPRSSRRSNS